MYVQRIGKKRCDGNVYSFRGWSFQDLKTKYFENKDVCRYLHMRNDVTKVMSPNETIKKVIKVMVDSITV